MNAVLPGVDAPVRDVSKSQWFTPPELARRIVDWALEPLAIHATVLEPSAGRGLRASAIRTAARKVAIGSPTCVEIDHEMFETLCEQGFDAIQGNFLEIDWGGKAFDLAIMNPPFEAGQTESHIGHALKFCERVVCHCPLTTLAGKDRREGLWSSAYLKRLVIHSSRPKYSGSLKGGMTDMCTIDVVRRSELVDASVRASGVEVSWWP